MDKCIDPQYEWEHIPIPGDLMDSNVIRAFLRVAEIGSLTRASEILGVSQPTLTRMIRRLEEEAGAKLFERTRRGMRMSHAGRHLAETLAPLVLEMEETVSALRTATFEPRGEIKVGIPHSMARSVAVPLVVWFAARFPKSQIMLQLGVSHEIEQALSFGQIDIGLLISPQTEARLVRVMPLATEPLLLLGPPGFAHVEQSADWTDIGDLPLIAPPMQNQLRRRIDAAARNSGVDLRILAEVSDSAVAMELVEKGLGHAILPESISRDMRDAGRLTGRRLGREVVVWSIAVSNQGTSLALRDSVEGQLRAIAATLATGSSWKLLDAQLGVSPTP